MSTRRQWLLSAGAGILLVPPFARTQTPGLRRIGMLSTGSATEPNNVMFTQGLRELGYVEGKNVLIERRFTEGNLALLPSMAADLLRQKVDLIYAQGSSAALVAKRAAGAIPVVFVNVGDPVGIGLVASFARPGGNATGIAVNAHELVVKRLELLKLTFPKIRRLAMVGSDDAASAAVQYAEVRRTGKAMGIDVLYIDIRKGDANATRLAQLNKIRPDALYVVETPTNFFCRTELAELAVKVRLPAIFGTINYAQAGGLMSYGSNYESNYRRAAFYVDRILKGAKPGELPVEQPMRLQLVINLKAARAIGFAVSPELLLRADEVIE